MSHFQLMLRDWVKTSGFLTHELVKRFFLFYPILCIASDCYLQVQVAFQAWFETIEQPATDQESQVPAPPATSTREVSNSSTEGHVTRIPSREPGRPAVSPVPESDAEQPLNVEETVRNFLAEDLISEESNQQQ